MHGAFHHLAVRVARAMLLLAFALGSPSLGGAFRCCSTGLHGVRPGAAISDAFEAHSDATHHAPPATDTQPDPCDCVGTCCAAPTVASLHALPELPTGRRINVSRAEVARGDRRPGDTRGAFLLPFANAPPNALTA